MKGPRSSSGALASSVGTAARELAGKIRRMIVTRTNSAKWQITGHTLLDKTIETHEAENFAGAAGFYSRPKASEDVEAMITFPGGGGGPIILATRQEAVRRVVAADLAADETQIHNSALVIRIRSNGTIELRSRLGLVQPTIKATSYRAAEDALETARGVLNAALGVFATAIGALNPVTSAAAAVTLNAAIVTYNAAVATFQAAAASYVSTVVKVE